MSEPEVIRLSPVCMDSYAQHLRSQTVSSLQMELMVMRDLLRQIDPAHMYVFSAEYSAFLKHKLPEKMEEEQLDRHKDESALQVIDMTYDPKQFLGPAVANLKSKE